MKWLRRIIGIPFIVVLFVLGAGFLLVAYIVHVAWWACGLGNEFGTATREAGEHARSLLTQWWKGSESQNES